MSSSPGAATDDFLVTKEYRRFGEFCDACRRDRYIGLCYGAPGVGKTLSARHYARWELIESARPLYLWRGEPPAAALPCRTVVYTAPVVRAPSKIDRDIRDLRQRLSLLVEDATLALRGTANAEPAATPDITELLIVDEADRLKLVGLEQLRDIYDRGRLGLILIGMPGLERRMARYAQLYSRVGFVHQYRPLGAEELRFVLAHKWERLGLTLDPTDYTDAEAMAAIARVTGGNFRLVQRLFSQIERLLRINGLRTITAEVVQAARESLVIGEV
jgi:DNA transposition AAA+ family ATPase